MFVDRVVVGPYQTNCYILGQEETSSCWIVDPGSEPEAIISRIESHGVHPVAVLLTHTHWDHVTALPALREKYGDIEILVGRQDAEFLGRDAFRHFSETIFDRTFLDANREQLTRLPEPTTLLDDGQMLDDSHLLVIHTPGHTPGSLCFYSEKGSFLFSGDTLFASGVGRTDLYGGSYTDLVESCRRLMALPSAVRVLPGHGPSTTIGEEKAGNPFCGGAGTRL